MFVLLGEQLREPIHTCHAGRAAERHRQRVQRGIRVHLGGLERVAVDEHQVPVDPDHRRVEVGRRHAGADRAQRLGQRHALRARLHARRRELGERADAMVRRERNRDRRRVAQLEQRIEQRTDGAVDAQHLVVNLPGVGPEAMANHVGRGQRQREQIGAGSRSQLELRDASERERDDEIVHERRGAYHARRIEAVGRQRMREREARAIRFGGDAVGLRVRALREEERPLLPAVALRHAGVVELRHPRGQRIAVVLARHEPSIGRIPVHFAA